MKPASVLPRRDTRLKTGCAGRTQRDAGHRHGAWRVSDKGIFLFRVHAVCGAVLALLNICANGRRPAAKQQTATPSSSFSWSRARRSAGLETTGRKSLQ